MKKLLLTSLILVSFSQAMACLSGSAFYSVIHPQSLEMMGGAQVVFVGDVLVLGESFTITNGEKVL